MKKSVNFGKTIIIAASILLLSAPVLAAQEDGAGNAKGTKSGTCTTHQGSMSGSMQGNYASGLDILAANETEHATKGHICTGDKTGQGSMSGIMQGNYASDLDILAANETEHAATKGHKGTGDKAGQDSMSGNFSAVTSFDLMAANGNGPGDGTGSDHKSGDCISNGAQTGV